MNFFSNVLGLVNSVIENVKRSPCPSCSGTKFSLLGGSLCPRCKIFQSPDLTYGMLDNLSFRDLEWFITHYSIRTTVNKRHDLIKIILRYIQYRKENTCLQNSGIRVGETNNRSPINSDATNPNHSNTNDSTDTECPIKLEDLKFKSINQMSVHQLKNVLARNSVDYKSCLEKSELIEKVKLLYLSRTKLNSAHSQADDPPNGVCTICMDAPIGCVFLECGHVASCLDCSRKLTECPICRRNITRTVRIYHA